eukprot:1216641-Amphidinium_carterae.1
MMSCGQASFLIIVGRWHVVHPPDRQKPNGALLRCHEQVPNRAHTESLLGPSAENRSRAAQERLTAKL